MVDKEKAATADQGPYKGRETRRDVSPQNNEDLTRYHPIRRVKDDPGYDIWFSLLLPEWCTVTDDWRYLPNNAVSTRSPTSLLTKCRKAAIRPQYRTAQDVPSKSHRRSVRDGTVNIVRDVDIPPPVRACLRFSPSRYNRGGSQFHAHFSSPGKGSTYTVTIVQLTTFAFLPIW